MSADLAALILAQPDPAHGTPTGDGDWRIIYEALLPEHPESVVGVARVGIDVVSADVWTDLSEYVTGFRIREASDFGEHPEPGTLELTLRSPDHRFATWHPADDDHIGHRFRNGCPIRVSLLDPVADIWHPLFTGEIETAPEISAGAGALIVSTVTAIDTVSSRMSKVQQLEYEVDAGNVGDTIDNVIGELVDLAGFPYGTVVDLPIDDAGADYTIVGRTLLSGNVLEQLRRLANSVGRTVSADRYGRLCFVRRRPQLVTYSNAYTPATDPNAPAAITIDTASDFVIADTVHPVPADDAVVNAAEIKTVSEPGIFGPATVGEDAEAVRGTAVANSSVRYGLRASTSQSVQEIGVGQFLRWSDASAGPDTASKDRYGLRQVAIDLFPIYYGLFTAQQIVDNIVDLYAHDLWRIPNIVFDNRSIDLIAAARIGAAVTLDHDSVTFTGYLGAIEIRSTPMLDRCKIAAELTVHAYTLER
jgi:hypothetical protein